MALASALAAGMSGCGPTDEPTPEPGAAAGRASAPLVFHSGVRFSHLHQLSLWREEIDSPPQHGIARLTTMEKDHDHALVLTRRDLEALARGEKLSQTTTEDEGHVHVFELRVK